MTRAVSTVVDAAVAVLVVGVALALLAGVPADPPESGDGDAAAPTADVLATSTARVNYTLDPASMDRAEDGAVERRIHATLARLLAEAAVADARLDGQEVDGSDRGFEETVVAAVERAVDTPGISVQVRAVWRPFPGSDLEGRVVTGDDPPPGVAVHAATLSVPSGFPTVREASTHGGYRPVARVMANATVTGLFPVERTTLALRGEGPVAVATADRYRALAAALDADLGGVPGRGEVRRANRILVDRLAERFEKCLAREFESPEAAASNATVETVTVTVRTWSR